mgnify:CR=1 FL=1
MQSQAFIYLVETLYLSSPDSFPEDVYCFKSKVKDSNSFLLH